MAQSVARRLGKAEVTGSSPANSLEEMQNEMHLFFCVNIFLVQDYQNLVLKRILLK